LRQFFQSLGFAQPHKTIPSSGSTPSLSKRYKGFIGVFGLAFFGYYVAHILFALGEKHLNYPFSSMAFFSENRALKPYNVHRYFPIYTGRIDVFRKNSPHEAASIWRRGIGTFLRVVYEDSLFRVSTIQALEEIDRTLQNQLGQGLYLAKQENSQNYSQLMPGEHEKIVYRSGLMTTTPYPLDPGMIDLHMGYRAVRDKNGFRALVSKADWDEQKKQYVISIEHKGFEKPVFEILARYNVREDPTLIEPKKVPGYWENGKFFVENIYPVGDTFFCLIKVKDEKLNIEEIYYGPDNFQSYR
jgi:hypothetical protein